MTCSESSPARNTSSLNPSTSRSPPDGGDGVSEPHRHGVPLLWGGRRHGFVGPDDELVDPHVESVWAGDGERTLLENLHTHALQHRQQPAQRRRIAAEVPGEKQFAVGVAGFELQPHPARGHRLHETDVVDGLLGVTACLNSSGNASA